MGAKIRNHCCCAVSCSSAFDAASVPVIFTPALISRWRLTALSSVVRYVLPFDWQVQMWIDDLHQLSCCDQGGDGCGGYLSECVPVLNADGDVFPQMVGGDEPWAAEDCSRWEDPPCPRESFSSVTLVWPRQVAADDPANPATASVGHPYPCLAPAHASQTGVIQLRRMGAASATTVTAYGVTGNLTIELYRSVTYSGDIGTTCPILELRAWFSLTHAAELAAAGSTHLVNNEASHYATYVWRSVYTPPETIQQWLERDLSLHRVIGCGGTWTALEGYNVQGEVGDCDCVGMEAGSHGVSMSLTVDSCKSSASVGGGLAAASVPPYHLLASLPATRYVDDLT